MQRMSPRPRQASDDDMLRATFRVLARVGPARLTLAGVAREAGVSAPAVVQRFGSRRSLLLAAAADAAGGSDYIFPGLRQRHRSPLAALLGLAECMALMGSTPDAVANTLAFSQLELSDPEFRRLAVRGAERMQEGLRALVRDGVAAGELRRCDAGRLARALLATINGSLMAWALHREGGLVRWIRRDLETVLRPYAADSARRRPSGARRRNSGRSGR